MRDFAITFEYLCENDADEAFTALLSKSFVTQATRTALLNKYEIWKRNEGPTFWAPQTATPSLLIQTVGELVAEGTHVAKDLVRKRRVSIVSSGRRAQRDETSQSQGSHSTHENTKGNVISCYVPSTSVHVFVSTMQTTNATMHIPNPSFSLPSHNLDKGTESSTHITDPPLSLDSLVFGQDSARSVAVNRRWRTTRGHAALEVKKRTMPRRTPRRPGAKLLILATIFPFCIVNSKTRSIGFISM